VYAAKGFLGMLSKFAATVLLSIVVLIVVTLFVSLGVLWWTGDGTRSVLIGVICGASAVLTVRAVSWYGRSGERSGDEDRRSRAGRDR
jgi:uncharacterized membrane protein YadS